MMEIINSEQLNSRKQDTGGLRCNTVNCNALSVSGSR